MEPTDGHAYNIPTNIESTNVDDIINNLKCENAYLRGMVKAYEKFLEEKGYIDNGDMEHSSRFHK